MTTATLNGTTADDKPDLALRPNGTIVARFNDREYRLRRPFLGELREIRSALDEMNDELTEMGQGLADAAIARDEATNSSGLEGDELRDRKRADVAAARGAGRDFAAHADRLRIGWWRLVFERLSMGGPLPEDDDRLPGWMLDPGAQGQIINHFRTVPFGSGALGP